MRVAILGASGLVGASLVEYLRERGDTDYVPLINSTGNAWRLVAAGENVRTVNMLDQSSLDDVLSDCTHVVNCSRGGQEVMLTGISKLLSACKRAGVRKLVHLSSVAIFGDPPPSASVTEIDPAPLTKDTYGGIKLAQDKMVQAATATVPSIILCPPNIIGQYSYFLLQILNAIRSGEFALLEDGSACCSTVDVRNLSHAIYLALEAGPSDGSRLFVTDDAAVSWRNLCDGLLPLAPGVHINSVDREALRVPEVHRPKGSFFKSIKHLVSSDVREALRKDPGLERVDILMRGLAAKMGTAVEERLRLSIEGPMQVNKRTALQALNTQLCSQQLRGVDHSCARLKQEIDYAPLVSFDQSMAAFTKWYTTLAGSTGPAKDLFNVLK